MPRTRPTPWVCPTELPEPRSTSPWCRSSRRRSPERREPSDAETSRPAAHLPRTLRDVPSIWYVPPFMPRFLLAAVLVVAGCRSQAPATPLRVSMIPTTDPSKALREMQPLADYLGKHAETTVEITNPTNYAAVVEALINDQVDGAHLGGFTYVQASQR